MIFAKSFQDVSPDRFVGKLFNGELYARTNYLGSDVSHRDTPQALLVEQSPDSIIPTHFHGIDQFQVIVQGDGHLGRKAVEPVALHYANAYTAYGPIRAASEGIFYFTLRAQSEPGAFFIPRAREFQKANKRRNLTAEVDALRDAEKLKDVIGIEQTVLFEPEDEGLAALHVRLGPGSPFTGPDPRLGGGQYYLVLNGALEYGGQPYERWSCIFVQPPEQVPDIVSGAQGAELLVLQFPFWERGTTLDPDAPLYAEDKAL